MIPVSDSHSLGQNETGESLQVKLLELILNQTKAHVVIYISDECTKPEGITIEREGQELFLIIYTRRPEGDIACPHAFVSFQEVVKI